MWYVSNLGHAYISEVTKSECMDSGDISTQLTVRLWRNSKFQKLLRKLEEQEESTNLVFCLSLELESEKKKIFNKKKIILSTNSASYFSSFFPMLIKMMRATFLLMMMMLGAFGRWETLHDFLLISFSIFRIISLNI